MRTGQEGKTTKAVRVHHIGKESCSLGRRLAGGLPRRLEEIEHRMPGEGQKVESSEDHGQELFAMAKIVLERISATVSFETGRLVTQAMVYLTLPLASTI